jgi:hypothetical protein
MVDNLSEKIIMEFDYEPTDEDKIIYLYSDLEILFMKQNDLFSCSYLGESNINKLEFVLAFFRKFNLKEYDGKNRNYIILNGKDISDSYDTLVKAFENTKDISFVIFTQSEYFLNNDDNILLIKYLNEYNRQYNSGSISFNVSSKYIFLSDYDCFENVSAVRKDVFTDIVRTIFGNKK